MRKHLRLVLLATALCGSTGAWAQVSAGDYIIQNVETGAYFAGGRDWGTHATLLNQPQIFTLAAMEDGKYSLDSHQYNSATAHFLNGDYVDGTEKGYTIAQGTSEGVYTISDGANYISAPANVGDALITNSTDATALAAQWRFITLADALAPMATATIESPADASLLIKNYEMKRNMSTSNEPNWTATSYDGSAAAGNFNWGNNASIANCAESWHSSNGFKVTQTVTEGVEPGVYRLTAHGCVSDGSKLTLSLNGESVDFATKTTDENSLAAMYTAFMSGQYKTEPIFVEVEENGSLTITIQNESGSSTWNIFGQLNLLYYGNVSLDDVLLKEYIDRYNTALNSANETAALNLKISNASKTALQDVIDANTGLTSAAGQEALVASAVALENAVIAANTAAENYESIKNALESGKFVNLPAFDHIANLTTYLDFDEIEKGYNEGTLSDANNGDVTVGNKYREYLRTISDSYRNANAFGTNVEIAEATANNQTPPDGWTQIEGASNKGTIAIDNDDSNGSTVLFENWKSGGLPEGNMYTEVTGLPNGKYFLRATAATRSAAATDYIYIKSGENEAHGIILHGAQDGNPAGNGAWISLTEPIEVTNGSVELGLHVGSGTDWAQIGVVELKAYEIYDQTATNEVADVQYGTICLPYAATTDAPLYTASAEDGKTVELTVVEGGKLEAGKAYIYGGNEATFTYAPEANLVAAPVTTNSLTGVFSEQLVPVGKYVLQAIEGHRAFYCVAEGKQPTAGAYRAYLTAPEAGGVRNVMELGDEMTTALKAVEALQNGTAEIYDVNGRKLQKLQKGVNIVNGTKIIVK